MQPDESTPICVLGSHELDYPRNQVLQDALRRSGRTLILCHSRAGFPWRNLILAYKFFRLPRAVRVVYVTEGGHRLVPLVRLWAKLTGRKILFDPFLSRYNTRVEDHQWYRPGSLQARVAYWQDWSSCRSADHLIFDTEEHRAYFYEKYELTQPATVVPVGVPEDVFEWSDRRPEQHERATVLFYGTFIPLQGIETIVRAGVLLPDSINIRIIGKGQTWQEMTTLADELGVTARGVEFEEPVPFETLPGRLLDAPLTLGIFGTTDKAVRVVPNKVVQAAAMGRPIITADTPAIRRYFTHGENIWLVPAGDPDALAAAIIALIADPDTLRTLGAGARRVFEASFSLSAITRLMDEATRHLEFGESGGRKMK